MFIDSLAGVSFKNLPFILFQIIGGSLTTLLIIKLLKLAKDNKSLLIWSLLFILLFIVAITSVPLSLLAAAIVLSFIFKNSTMATETKFAVLIIAFVSAAGHLVLLFISLIIVLLYAKLIKRNDK